MASSFSISSSLCILLSLFSHVLLLLMFNTFINLIATFAMVFYDFIIHNFAMNFSHENVSIYTF